MNENHVIKFSFVLPKDRDTFSFAEIRQTIKESFLREAEQIVENDARKLVKQLINTGQAEKLPSGDYRLTAIEDQNPDETNLYI